MKRTQNPLLKRLGAPQVEPPWSLGEAGLTLIILAISLLLIAPASAALLYGSTTSNPDTASWLLAWIIGLLITGIFVIVRWRRIKSKFDALKLDAGRLPLPLMFVLGVAVALTASLIASTGSGVLQSSAELSALQENIGGFVLAIILLVIVQPVVDSLLFAGVILPRLRYQFGGYLGLLLMAFLFAAYHAVIYGGRLEPALSFWYGFMMPLVLGIALGVARVWGGSTLAAIVLHMGYGMMVVAIVLIV